MTTKPPPFSPAEVVAAKVKDAEAEVAVLVQFSSSELAVATAEAAVVVQFYSPELVVAVAKDPS